MVISLVVTREILLFDIFGLLYIFNTFFVVFFLQTLYNLYVVLFLFILNL